MRSTMGFLLLSTVFVLSGFSSCQIGDEYLDSDGASGYDKGAFCNGDPDCEQDYANLFYLEEIRADQAWRFSQGEGIHVAVVDTGIDFSHEDLAANIEPDPADRFDNTDLNGHGTAVAGVLAAVKDNGVGIAGVAPSVKVVPYKVTVGDGTEFDFARGAAAATLIKDHPDIDVVNISGSLFNDGLNPVICSVLVRPAVLEGKVVIVIAGNGDADNNGGPYDVDAGLGVSPANCPETITVGGAPLGRRQRGPDYLADHDAAKSSFANFGTSVDLVAFAGNGLNTDPGAGSPAQTPTGILYEHNNILTLRAAGTSGVRDGISGLNPDGSEKIDITDAVTVGSAGRYLRWRGTSFAAPQVAGTVALMLASSPTLNAIHELSSDPNAGLLKTEAVRGLLHGSTRSIPGQTLPNPNLGHGMLDTLRAVQVALRFEFCMQSNQNEFGYPDAFIDSCVEIAITTDTDGDGVLDAEDNCVETPNPIVSNPLSFQTTTGGQLDDDGDGYGNACDGDFDNLGAIVGGVDVSTLLFNFGSDRSGACLVAGSWEPIPCAVLDMDGAGQFIDDADLDYFNAALFGFEPGPKCADCPLICDGPNCTE